jgi:hypothetical protein
VLGVSPMIKTQYAPPRFESKGTWFETQQRPRRRIQTVCCPVCQTVAPVGLGDSRMRVMSYLEQYDPNRRALVVKIDAICSCGTNFALETVP